MLPRRSRSCRTAARQRTARAAGDEDTQGGRHDIETLGEVLSDLMKRAATTDTCLRLDIDDLFDPLQMCRQRTPVGLPRCAGALLALS